MNQGESVSDIEVCLPDTVLTNEQLAKELGTWTPEQIFEKTGIKQRHIAAPDECASDLAVRAAQALFARGGAQPDEIDFVLFCTQSPDYILPTSACLIQDRLGLRRDCGALDFNLGCSGYVYGLSLAKGLIASGQARNVLLLTADTYSKFINAKDPSVRTLFGDAATATLVRGTEGDESHLGPFRFGTDGRGAKNLIVPAGAARTPKTEATGAEAEDSDGNVRSEDNLYMNGREIFRFAITSVPKLVKSLLEDSALDLTDIDHLVLHQGSRFMLDEVIRKLKCPPEKAPRAIENYGNTVSSTIPLVIKSLMDGERLKSGDRLMLVGFGVGYSWAGTILKWS